MAITRVDNLGRPRLKRDSDTNRTYTMDFLVESDDLTDGPKTILGAAALPQPGDYYQFQGETDTWAFCKWDMTCAPMHRDQGKSTGVWKVTQTFTTKPDAQDNQSEKANPLDVPPVISGGWNQVPRKRHVDKNNKPITNSSLEPITSDDVLTRNIAQPTVDIAMNTATLPLDQLSTAINRVNSVAMWGLAPRHVRLYNCPWRRNIMTNGFIYYTVTYQFECSFESWDLPFVDSGFKVYVGPEPENENDPRDPVEVAKPSNYSRPEGVDQDEDPFPLDGAGNRLAAGADVVLINPQIELEYNFFLLGIPTSL